MNDTLLLGNEYVQNLFKNKVYKWFRLSSSVFFRPRGVVILLLSVGVTTKHGYLIVDDGELNTKL